VDESNFTELPPLGDWGFPTGKKFWVSKNLKPAKWAGI